MNTTVKFVCLVAAATQLVTFAHAGLASAVAKNRETEPTEDAMIFVHPDGTTEVFEDAEDETAEWEGPRDRFGLFVCRLQCQANNYSGECVWFFGLIRVPCTTFGTPTTTAASTS